MDNTALGAVNFSRLCRVCLMEFKEMYSLFSFIQFDDNLKKPVYLYEMLMSISSMKISPEDHLPAKVCTNCKQLAHTSYKFQQQCNRSQEVLDSYLPNKNVMAKQKPLNLDSGESTKCNVYQEIDSYLSDKHFTIEEKPLHLDSEEKLQEEPRQDSIFADNVFVKIEVDEPTHTTETVPLENDKVFVKIEVDESTDTPEIVPVDVSQQQGLLADPLEERNFDNSNDYCEAFNISDSESEVAEAAKINDLVPTKSASIYQAAYSRFISWCEKKNTKSFTENVFMAYFLYLSTETNMKSSSLWSNYSMIKSIMNIKHGMDISRFLKLRAFLKKQNECYTPKKSRVFTKEELDRFLSDAPDQQCLGLKIVLVIGISGACRCDEMVKMRTEDFQDLGSLILVKIRDTGTKKSRSFTIVEDKFIDIYRKYISLRPKNMHDSRFFIKYINGKCHRAVMGLHKIGGVPKEVASFLQLSNCGEYTGHSLRRTSATLLFHDGAGTVSMKRHAEDYIEKYLIHKQDVAMKMLCPNINVVTPEVNAPGPSRTPAVTESPFLKLL